MNQIITAAATGFLIGLVVYALFRRADDLLSADFKAQLARRFYDRDFLGVALNEWPVSFLLMFHHLFGHRILTWRFLLRTTLASFTYLAMLASVYFATIDLAVSFIIGLDFTAPKVVCAILLYCILSYVAFVASRAVLIVLCRSNNLIHLLLIPLDLFVKITCIWILAPAFHILLIIQQPFSLEILISTVSQYWSFRSPPWFGVLWLDPTSSQNVLGILFYSILLTSLWIWVYVGSLIQLRLMVSSFRLFRLVKFVFRVEEAPLQALGSVLAIMLAIFYWILVSLQILPTASILGTGIIGTGFLIFFLINALFWNADDLLSDHVQALLRVKIRDVTGSIDISSSVKALATTYMALFDAVFGKTYISWKRLRRSWAISTVSVIAMTLLWWFLRPEQFEALLVRTERDITGLFGAVIITAYILNLVPDYVSAIQTRWFIGMLNEVASSKLIVILIIVTAMILIAGDIMLTSLVFTFFFAAFAFSFDFLYGLSKEIRNVWDILQFESYEQAVLWLFEFGPTLQVHVSGNVSIGVFFYSTFFASVWLWIFVSALIMGNFGAWMLRPVYSFLGPKMAYAVEWKPIRFIGLIGATIGTVGYWSVAAFA